MMVHSFMLPIPPSTNNLFATIGRRRVVTRAYREWRATAAAMIAREDARTISGWVRIDIALPITLRGDVSNRVKAIEDALVSARVIADDRFVSDLRVTRETDAPYAFVTVRRDERDLDERVAQVKKIKARTARLARKQGRMDDADAR